MSAEETKHLPKSDSFYSANGRTNPGFDDPLTTREHGNITDSHGRNQANDWKKYASDSMEDFLSRCPGSHGPLKSSQQSSGGQDAADQWDPSMKVYYLIAKF